jgi:hypothetical protein
MRRGHKQSRRASERACGRAGSPIHPHIIRLPTMLTWLSSVMRCSSLRRLTRLRECPYCHEEETFSTLPFCMMSLILLRRRRFSCSICAYRSSIICSRFTLRRYSPKPFGGLMSTPALTVRSRFRCSSCSCFFCAGVGVGWGWERGGEGGEGFDCFSRASPPSPARGRGAITRSAATSTVARPAPRGGCARPRPARPRDAPRRGTPLSSLPFRGPRRESARRLPAVRAVAADLRRPTHLGLPEELVRLDLRAVHRGRCGRYPRARVSETLGRPTLRGKKVRSRAGGPLALFAAQGKRGWSG